MIRATRGLGASRCSTTGCIRPGSNRNPPDWPLAGGSVPFGQPLRLASLAARRPGVLALHGERSNEPNERAAAIRAVLSASLLTAERGRRIGAQHAAAGHDGRHNPDESRKQWGDEQCDGVAWSDSVQL